MLNFKAIDTFIEMQNSANTQETYRRGIRRFLHYMTITRGLMPSRQDWPAITTEDVVAWKTDLTNNLSPASASTYWDGVNSFFNWLLGRGMISRHPFAGVKKPKRVTDQQRRVVDDEWVKMLVRNAGSGLPYELRLRDRAIVGLMSNGLRISEIASLDIKDLNLRDGPEASVTVTGKGAKQRVVPLNHWLAYIPLHEYVSSLSNVGDGPMFRTVDGRRMSTRSIQVAFQRAMRASGAAKMGHSWSPHSLRHNYATRMLRRGVSLPVVAKLLGHSDVKTTMVYLHLDHTDTLEAAKMDTLGSEDQS